MPRPQIIAVATSNPDLYISQLHAYDFYQQNNLMPVGQKSLYSRLLREGPVDGRYFALGQPADIIGESADAQIARFSEQGCRIAAKACRAALAKSELAPRDIGGIVVNTCTGYLCPGLTSYLAEELDLEKDIKVIDIMGMGCGAAIPNLECGCGMIDRNGGRPVLCVSVEICSATHFIDDDPGLTVSNCIFGDGASALVVGPESAGPKRVALLDFETGLFPEYRQDLRYRHDNGHLRNELGSRVPVIGAKCLEKVTRKILARNRLAISDLRWWAVHAGGTLVLQQVGRRLGLVPDQLAASLEVFREYGNMSSPTVIFVLDRLLRQGQARGPGMLLAFGAGFTAFAALASGESHES